MQNLGLIILGGVTGVLSGIVGIGGGIIIVPALVFFLGYSQHLAQGTAVAAMVPPIGLMAAYVYYKNGNANLLSAALIALGFFVGGYFGAKIANQLPQETLKRAMGVAMVVIGAKLLFTK